MKTLTPQQAKDLGYKSITTDIDPTSTDKKTPPNTHVMRLAHALTRKEITPEEFLVEIAKLSDSRYGVSEWDILQSMRENMRGIDAVWIVFAPTKWQLGRLNREILTHESHE